MIKGHTSSGSNLDWTALHGIASIALALGAAVSFAELAGIEARALAAGTDIPVAPFLMLMAVGLLCSSGCVASAICALCEREQNIRSRALAAKEDSWVPYISCGGMYD